MGLIDIIKKPVIIRIYMWPMSVAGSGHKNQMEGYMAKIKNRRRGPDTMVRMITISSVVSWLVIFIAFIIYQMVHPSGGSYNAVRKTMIDFSAGVIVAKALLFLNFLLCVWGMIMNSMRNRRKSDRFRISLVISAFISLAGFIVMMIFL